MKDKYSTINSSSAQSSIQFTNMKKNISSDHFLTKKRNSDHLLQYPEEKTLNSLLSSNKLLKIISKNEKDEIINKKLEFKLSHILQGENTKLEVDEKINNNANKNFYKDSYIDNLLYWKNSERIGPGFNNLGNTCFLNSVLQSLLYTSPLKNYLYSSDHMKMCKNKGICFLCELGKLINFTKTSKTPSITPRNIIQNLNLIAKSLRIGRQEDAHEFLLYLLEALEKSAKQFKLMMTNSFVSKDPNNEIEDNLIQKIFGGNLNSSVVCTKCGVVSKKLDNFLDISLHIHNSENIEKCFENFCKPEHLNGNNKYFCENCKCRNDSIKKISFEKFPRILILHLKRFDNFQRKIKKFVKYDNIINLTRFINKSSNQVKEEFKYRLFSVLIHDGYSINSGHYYSNIKNSDGLWYSMNDSWVSKTNDKNVLNQTPYLLFYERIIQKNNDLEKHPIETKIKSVEQYSNIEKKEITKDLSSSVPCKKVQFVAEDEDKYELNNLINLRFCSSKRKKMKKLLRVFKYNIFNRKSLFNVISPSTENDSVESDNSVKKLQSIYNIKNNIPDNFNGNHKYSQNYNLIYNKNLTNLYGSEKIELWDTEEDSGLLKNQINFIKKSNNFNEMPILEKDEYDINYDMGKLKKVKLHKALRSNENVFQKIHDKMVNKM